MVLFVKKNVSNENTVSIDEIQCDSKLVIPRLTTAQRDAQGSVNGDILYNIDTNTYEFYENGTWKTVTMGGAGTFVTIAGNETITGLKLINNDLKIDDSGNRHILFRTNTDDVFALTLNNNTPNYDMRIIGSDDPTAVNRSLQFGYYTGNNRANAFNEKWKVTYQANNNATMNLNNSQVLSGDSSALDIGSHSNLRLTSTGLKVGEAVNPTSLLHLKTSNPTLSIESLAGGTSTLLMNGQTNNIIDFAGVANLSWSTGSQRLNVRDSASDPFVGFDFINKNCSVGSGAINLPNSLLNLKDATKQKYLTLPFVNNANEGSLPTSSDYYGGIYYNEDTNEIKANIGGSLVDMLHAGSTDITEANIAGITSQPVGINDTQTLTNKTHADVQFTLGAAPSHSEGLLFYDNVNKCVACYNENSNVTHQLGQEFYIRCHNNTVSTIPNASVVYCTGVSGAESRMSIAPALANSSVTSRVVGITTHDIPAGQYGYVTAKGIVSADTSSFTAGAPLYLSDSVAGALTTTAPTGAGSYKVLCGFCVLNFFVGSIYVSVNPELQLSFGDSERLVIDIRKGSVGTLAVGSLVYISGWNNGAGVLECELADNTSTATTPCIGIVTVQATNSVTGKVVSHGRVENINTSAYSVGQRLYLGTGGAFTNTRPTGNVVVQELALVARSNVNGVLDLVGGHPSDLNNMSAPNHIFLSDSNNHPVSTLLSTAIANNNGVTTNTTQTITGLKTFNNEVYIQNNKFLRLRTDSVGSNPHIFGFRYTSGGSECLNIATSDAAATTSICMGYFGSDNYANAFNERAKIDYNNTSSTNCRFLMDGNVMLSNQTLGSSIINSSLQNVNSDTLNINGQTATDALLKLTRSTGEYIQITSKTTGASFSNNTSELMVLNNTGLDLTQSGDVYKIAGTQVVGARDTGYTAFTGTLNKATAYNTATVSLQQLAERVAQLQLTLAQHGLID